MAATEVEKINEAKSAGLSRKFSATPLYFDPSQPIAKTAASAAIADGSRAATSAGRWRRNPTAAAQ
jgi:hypothetical protein